MCGTCTPQRPSGPCAQTSFHSTARGVAGGSYGAVESFERGRQDSRVYRGSMDLLVRRRMLVAAVRVRERESNASLALRVGSDARLESWEHSEKGRGFSQRSNALGVWKAASEPHSTFPVEYRRAHLVWMTPSHGANALSNGALCHACHTKSGV
eukprot:354229-Chlamydomonas_euryale.AAC.6